MAEESKKTPVKKAPVKKAQDKKAPAETAEPAPVAAERWDPLTSLRREMDRLFEDFVRHWPEGPFGRRGLFSPLPSWPSAAPAVDVVDLEKEIQIRAELPGMEETDIDIEIAGDMLAIRGEKKEEAERGEKGGRYYLSERRYGAFERSLRLPEGTDRGKPDARFAKGVLTVTFPKIAAARETATKVQIKGE